MKWYFILILLFPLFLYSFRKDDSVHIPLLRLKDVINDVIKRNPDLAAIQSRVKAAVSAVPRVQVLDDPVFTMQFWNNPFGSKTDFVRQQRFRLSQKIPFIGKLRLRGEIAQHILEFIESEEETTYRTLISQAKRLFFQLFFNKAARQVNKENRDIASRLIDDAMVIYTIGKGSQDDILKAQIELQKLNDELLMLLSEKETLISLINALMDRSQLHQIGEPEDIAFPQIVFDYKKLESIALRERSELEGLKARITQEETIAQLARRDYYPDFNLTLMLQNLPGSDNTAWGIDFSFNMPIWVNQKQRREKEEAEARAMANMHELVSLRAKIRGRIRELLAKINEAEERASLYRTGIIPKTAETLTSNEANYLVGQKDFLTVLDTRRQLHDFQLTYEQARVDRELWIAELEWEIGVPLETVIQPKPLVHFERVAKNKSIIAKTKERKRSRKNKNKNNDKKKKSQRCTRNIRLRKRRNKK